MKREMTLLAVRAFCLLLATTILAIAAWLVFTSVCNGISAKLMTFEQEPAQGWAYWRWHFIKQSMWGILGTVAILLGFAAVVSWGWLALVRDVRRKHNLPGKQW